VTDAAGAVFARDQPLTVLAGGGDDAGASLYLQSRDRHFNKRPWRTMADSDPFTATLALEGAAAEAEPIPLIVDDLRSGVYRVRVAATRAGSYTLQVSLDGERGRVP
jgi:hypothetical protein